MLSSGWKKEKLPKLQAQILKKPFVVITENKTQNSGLKTHLGCCPSCKIGSLITLLTFDSRGPPKGYLKYLENSIKN